MKDVEQLMILYTTSLFVPHRWSGPLASTRLPVSGRPSLFTLLLQTMTPPPSPKPPPAMAKLEDDDTTQLLSLLSPDFTPRVRTGTVVTESFGFTSLAPGPPVLNVNLEKNDKSEEQEQLSKTRDLFHNHQAHISADPVTVSRRLGCFGSLLQLMLAHLPSIPRAVRSSIGSLGFGQRLAFLHG